ncbi:MAG: hypothetical protein KGI54_05030 [Pseudomonadota bacterium]|nr:hypothetical protein [Pseudomonadota bacterium]
MRFLVSIDDTDNLDSPGTGEVAQWLREHLECMKLAKTTFITRHQLFIHPDIAYTSHNSSMCFIAEAIAPLNTIIPVMASKIREFSSLDSDPGLCIASLDSLQHPEELVAFGKAAKTEVLNKDMAYALALKTGAHLSEHGGDGSGVIGALAGAGLRLSGEDGKLRGSLSFSQTLISVSKIRIHPDIQDIRTLSHETITDDELVEIVDKPKTVMQEGKAVLLLTHCEASRNWRTLTRKELKNY